MQHIVFDYVEAILYADLLNILTHATRYIDCPVVCNHNTTSLYKTDHSIRISTCTWINTVVVITDHQDGSVIHAYLVQNHACLCSCLSWCCIFQESIAHVNASEDAIVPTITTSIFHHDTVIHMLRGHA